MSGGEFIPGAAAAAKGAGKAVRGSDAERERIAGAAMDHPAMDMAVEAYAKRVAVRQAFLLKLFEPLGRLIGFSKEYFASDFGEDLARKTAHIPEDHLTSPSPVLAFPAMTGLGYSLDEPDLKEMYLNLLAAATDDRRSAAAHPAFAEIIRQLTPTEANALLVVLRLDIWPMVQVRRVDEDSYSVVRNHVIYLVNSRTGTPLRSADSEAWIDNWSRLGLFTARYDQTVARSTAYDWATGHPDVTEEQEAEPEGVTIEIRKGSLQITAFGKRFAVAVTPPNVPREDTSGGPVEPDPNSN